MDPFEKNSGLIECNFFSSIVKDSEEKYDFFLTWFSNEKYVYKSTLKSVQDLKSYISSFISNQGVIVFSAKKLNKMKNCQITQIPLSLDLYKTLTSETVISNLERIINNIVEEYDEQYARTGTKDFIEKKIRIREAQESNYSLKLIVSSFKKAISTGTHCFNSKHNIYVTLRYEPLIESEKNNFFYNYVSLPAEPFLQYLKTQTLSRKIESDLKRQNEDSTVSNNKRIKKELK